MNSIELLRKKILYRSEYRGIKEMELLLNSFVKKHINDFSIVELKQLDDLLNFDDDSLFKWYLNKKVEIKIPNNKVSKLLKNFKI
jgi:antitoxin CptB